MIRRLELNLFRSVRNFVQRSPRKFVLGGSLTMMALYSIPTSACASDNKGSLSSILDSFMRFTGVITVNPEPGPETSQCSDAIHNLIDDMTPTLQKLGFGGLMGICTGIAMKRIGNGAAAAMGIGFVCLQGLSYAGYIKIDFGKVQKDVTKLVDANGDGKVDSSDLKLYWNKLQDVLSYNLPGASGFSAGVVMGLYWGR